MLILIPAYEPDIRLVRLVRDLRTLAPDAAVLVVDDGSGPRFDVVFDVAADVGARVLRFAENRGKGAALKAGFSHAAEFFRGQDVVCADCDGQHTPRDILTVVDAVRPGTVVLGVRRFSGRVPARSRVGNALTTALFALVAGHRVSDTQTGLRAYPPDLLDWATSVEGDRFEYEFNLLLASRGAGIALREVAIDTVYLDRNASSHFRPVRDSLRVYRPMAEFAASSLTGFVVDAAALILLVRITGRLELSVAAARLISATCNFLLNRAVVFRGSGPLRREALRYAALAATVLAANLVLMELTVSALGWPLIVAKVVVEAALLVMSYVVQHRVVFAHRPVVAGPARSSVLAR